MACALVEAGCGDAIVDAITASSCCGRACTCADWKPELRVPISIMMRNQDPMSALHRDLIEPAARGLRHAAGAPDRS